MYRRTGGSGRRVPGGTCLGFDRRALGRSRLVRILALGLALVLGQLSGPAPAVATPIVEYPVGDRGDGFAGLAFGPDGNLWVGRRHTNQIDRVTPDGDVTRFSLPSSLRGRQQGVQSIVAGPDDALWFVAGQSLGRLTVDGGIDLVTVRPKRLGRLGIHDLAVTDDAVWFSVPHAGVVGRIDPENHTGTVDVTEYHVGTGSRPTALAAGVDGDVWFVDSATGTLGRIAAGRVHRTPLPAIGRGPADIAVVPSRDVVAVTSEATDRLVLVSIGDPRRVQQVDLGTHPGRKVTPTAVSRGPDGAVWVAAAVPNALARVDESGQVRWFPLPTAKARPTHLVVGPGKDLWFAEEGTGRIGRLSPGAVQSSVSELSLTVRPANSPAGREEIPRAALDAADLPDTSGLQSSPVRATPLRSIAVESSPLRSIPLRSIPLRSIGLDALSLAMVPLRSITWEELLAGTVYDGVPLQSVTLAEVMALDPMPPAVRGLSLAELDLGATPLRSISLAGLMLAGVPLERLPAPPGGWCAYLSQGSTTCADAVDPARTDLAALEAAGNDLASYYEGQLDLLAIDLDGVEPPITMVALSDIALDETPLGPIPTTAVRSLVTCTPTQCPTLADAQRRRALVTTATVGGTLELFPIDGVDRLHLGDLLLGLIVGADGHGRFPLEDVPLSTVLDNATIRDTDLLEYEARFTVDCVEAAGLRIDLALGEGFRPRPGSSKLRTSAHRAGAPVPDPSRDGHTWRFVVPTGDGGICDDVRSDGRSTGTLVVEVEPGATLGDYPASATASTALDRTAGTEKRTDTDQVPTATADASHDAGDRQSDAEPIRADVLYTGHIHQVGDVDLYEIPAPAPGSTLEVSLSHLPADYDLAVYGPSAAIPSTPLRSIPARSIAPRPLPLRSVSTQRGNSTESVSVPVLESDRGRHFLVEVSGYGGASGPEPYVLRAEIEPGPGPLPCRERAFTGTGEVTGAEFPSLPLPASTKTLILVDVERMAALYGAAPVEAMLSRLRTYAARKDVAGVVLPVGSAPGADVRAAMDGWDADPCSSVKANAVVAEINRVVDAVRPGLQELRSIVLVGSDEVLPMARVPDHVTIANEREYTGAALDGRDTAVSRALANGLTLSDDPYGDFDPQTWLSGRLYVPDVALGRLVETPEEITAQLEQYEEFDGVLTPDTGRVLGYDFLVDGSQAVGDALTAQVPTTTRTDDEWTSADALAALNASDPGYVAVNAHYNHYQALPAKSFHDQTADLVESADVSPARGAVLFTMGCHAGLNLPDIAVSVPGGSDQKASRRLLDWPQAVARHTALFTGNTGYGYGDTEVVAYSERLMQHYAEGLAGEQVTAGQALMFAKQRYIGDLGVVGVYDGKVVQQAVFYGLPTYRIGEDGREASPVLPPLPAPPVGRVASSSERRAGAQPNPAVGGGTTGSSLRTSPFGVDPEHREVETDRGSYWQVGDQLPQVTDHHPVEPRVTLDVTAEDGLAVHGAVIERMRSTDLRDVDPVFSRPTIDRSTREPEAGTDDVAFPAQPQSVNTIVTPGGHRDTLVLVTGQTMTHARGKATQRLFTHLSGTVYRSDSDDWTPPRIHRSTGVIARGAATFDVRTPDQDVIRGIVLYRGNSTADWHTVELKKIGDGRWSASLRLSEISGRIAEFNVQLVDHAGNVTMSTNKGWQFKGTWR